ncbi:hypothetical protein T4A_1474 [Trichinella pseudospiralis]|uniref:Uncharacterized protein n=1 Tax=Trichinella pseudospiralis TaxID=6337 RepID=A0A0V1ERR4_TRIPS|nr:hypothetical protein T4A_1474 [Trichinella pseudospiralis]
MIFKFKFYDHLTVEYGRQQPAAVGQANRGQSKRLERLKRLFNDANFSIAEIIIQYYNSKFPFKHDEQQARTICITFAVQFHKLCRPIPSETTNMNNISNMRIDNRLRCCFAGTSNLAYFSVDASLQVGFQQFHLLIAHMPGRVEFVFHFDPERLNLRLPRGHAVAETDCKRWRKLAASEEQLLFNSSLMRFMSNTSFR